MAHGRFGVESLHGGESWRGSNRAEAYAHALTLQRRGGLGVVVVDYYAGPGEPAVSTPAGAQLLTGAELHALRPELPMPPAPCAPTPARGELTWSDVCRGFRVDRP